MPITHANPVPVASVAPEGGDIADAECAAESPFAILAGLSSALAEWHSRLLAPAPEAFVCEAIVLGARLRTLVERFPDEVLGALLLDEQASYAQIHPLMVGALCELAATRAGIDAESRATMLAAVLTCNVGLLREQAALSRPGPLSPTLAAVVEEHPARSRACLRAGGVDDELWLELVFQHHERADGSGYPRGLRGAEIHPLARVIALADIYSAMVLPREYRTGIRAQQALRQIFLARGQRVDAALAATFIAEVGVFPPGSFVKLANGETGVVIRRGIPRRDAPLVSCFRSPRGIDYQQPLQRDCAQDSRFAVADMLGREVLNHAPEQLWGVTT